MRFLFALLVVAVLGAGSALAQMGTVVAAPGTTPTTEATIITPAAGTPMVVVAAPPAGQICPPSTQLPGMCTAVARPSVTGDTMILVLGYEETFALDNLNASNLGWRDYPLSYMSVFGHSNPLTHNQPNAAVVRHGNPYFPYYQAGPMVTVEGMTINR